ncbi:TetR/AcrR family transcriptional regulator [Solwaraspora sp. WMMB335]|uniref:TetR/AcrR family transcriptional regulator n=1 Tax=Solwaraspora sp. WMMB335 TaxID=3404118 RepID=UPI003B95F345
MPPQTAAERGRQVRQRLRAAAAELIAERGWAGVSTRLVADRAGVAPGLVHYHYASVQALLVEAATTVMTTLVGELDEVLARSATAADGVRSLLASLDGFSGTDPTSLLFTEAYLAATRDENLRHALAAVIDGLRERLAGWLAGHGVADPAATAAVLAAAIDGMMLHRPLSPGLTGAAVAPVLIRILTPATAAAPTAAMATAAAPTAATATMRAASAAEAAR